MPNPLSTLLRPFGLFRRAGSAAPMAGEEDANPTPRPFTLAQPAPNGKHHPEYPPQEASPAVASEHKRRRRRRKPRREESPEAGVEPSASAEAPDTSAVTVFGDLEVNGPLGRAIRDMGYAQPTPIQREVVPLMLAGRDVVGQAQTGTGKTSAFGIPLIQSLDPQASTVQAIILVPTRELAVQVTGEIANLAKYTGHRVVTLYGGQPISKQLVQLDPPPQIIVGTPGRVIDHLERGTLNLRSVKVAILDEADQMLDIGFAPDMERILRMTPRSRQTALFSATMPPFILRLINRYLKSPEWVHIDPEALTVPEIEQVYYEVAERDKVRALCALFEEWGELPHALIFCRMQVGVDRLTAALRRRGYPVEGIHGGMTQAERTRVMTGFRAGSVKALVATNVASRGLDIPDVTVIVSYDAPQNLEEHVHRIGRTGRMGRKGLAVTFVAEWDFDVLDSVKSAMGEALRQERSSIYSGVAV